VSVDQQHQGLCEEFNEEITSERLRKLEVQTDEKLDNVTFGVTMSEAHRTMKNLIMKESECHKFKCMISNKMENMGTELTKVADYLKLKHEMCYKMEEAEA
jgi:hypothetical protein